MARLKYFKIVIFLILFLPATALADTWEYVTYGGYDAAVNAWKRIGLIFSSASYNGLFLSVIVLGAIAIFISTYVRILFGARTSAVSWSVPVLIGMVMYVTFISPKDTITIYDEKLNRGPYQVSNIPKIIAMSAGLLNKIEKGFIEIISTSSDPVSDYRLNSGATGWKLLEGVKGEEVLTPSQSATLKNFIKDCVFVELLRNGTPLSIDKIASGEQKYDYVISQSANPNIYTIVYPENSGAEGETKTCSEASSTVLTIMNTAASSTSNYVNSLCKSNGYTTPTAITNCKNLLSSVITSVWSSGTTNLFIAQKTMADIFQNVIINGSPNMAIASMATAQTQSQFIGLGIHANSWIPVLKESLTAVAISIAPVILLFVATPFVGRALSLTLGMFVWLALWGVIDAIIHSFGVDLAQQYSESLKTMGDDMGFVSMLGFPGYTGKIAATFGALRWSGLMLASVISGMLIKFGGTALAMLAGSIAGMPQSSGAAYGGSVLRNAHGVLQNEVMPTQTWASALVAAGGVSNLVSGLVQKQAGEMAGGASFGNRLGVSRIARATEGQLLSGAHGGEGALNAINQFGYETAVLSSQNHHARLIGHGSGYEDMGTAFKVGSAGAQSEIGTVQGKQIIADSLGQSLKEYAEFEAKGRILDQKMADRLNQRYNTDVFKTGMRLDYGTDGQGNFFIKATKSDPFVKENIDISGSGIRIEKTVNDLMVSGNRFTGSMNTIRSWDGKEFTSLQGTFTDSNGVTRYGNAYLDTNGNLVFFDSKSGINMQDSMRHSQMLTLSGEQLKPIVEQLRAAGPQFKNTADGIEKAMKEGRAVAFLIERDPTTGQIATIHAGTGGTFKQEDFRTNQKGWENITKAVSKGEFGSHNTYYHGSEDHHYGTRVNIGSELPYIVTTGDWRPLQEKYSDMWYNPMMGKQVAIKAADSVGIFGKFEQLTKDSAAIGHQLRTKNTLLKFLSAGGLDYQAYLKGERSAIEQVNANTLALGITKRYEQIQADRNLTIEQKNKLFAQELHALYKELEFYGGASTLQQLEMGANNPYKGQRIPEPKGYDPTTAGDAHGQVAPFR